MPNEALIIIDVQNAIFGFADTPRRMENHAALDEVVAGIATLIGRARRQGIPVLFVQHDGPRGYRLETGTPGWEIRSEIAPIAGDPVIHKKACDSFFETTLMAELKSRNVDRLIVAGCMTQFCVDTTVRRAVSLGFDVTLVRDGHMTTDSGGLTYEQIIVHHNALLDGFDAGTHSVRVVPRDQIILS
jgi:nicotinamidase-related amidase